MDSPLLEIRNLKKYFPVSHGLFSGTKSVIKALNGIDLTLYRGETLGLVGESGCGKSTLGRLILRLDEPTGGTICFEGRDVFGFKGRALQDYRKDVQIVFQDPYAALNPRQTVYETVAEPFKIHHGIADRQQMDKKVADLLARVGLTKEQHHRYPHEFSGGQRQRIGIARALALSPRLIVADEPVSALDVSIQAQILNLLKDLQSDLSLTYLFITHDLSVVRHMSDRIAVMYFGRIVELAATEMIYGSPAHPYTRALLSSIPIPIPHRRKRPVELGEDPLSQFQPEKGCTFEPRCPVKLPVCAQKLPALRETAAGHRVACHRSST